MGFVFASTWFIYTWQRFAKLKTGQHFASERLRWMQDHRKSVNAILWISGTLAAVLVFCLKWNTLIILIPAGVLSGFYVGRFLLKQIKGFRDLPFLKAYVVSVAWTAMLVFLPLMQTKTGWSAHELWYALAVFCFIFSLAVIFDLRDAPIDHPGMKTLPQLLGKKGTLFVAILALFISIVIVSIIQPNWILPGGIIALTGIVLMLISVRRTDDFFYSFWLDGYLFLPGLFALNYWIL